MNYLQNLEAKEESELNPQRTLEEKRNKEIIQKADVLSSEKLSRKINDIKIEIGSMFSTITDKMEQLATQYSDLGKAVSIKEQEIQEVYEIEKSALTLAALIEVQKQKKIYFEKEMAQEKENLLK